MKKQKSDKGKKVRYLVQLNLKEIREQEGLTQSDLRRFKQASVSKIESRDDIKLSTLIKYLDALDLDLQLIAINRNSRGNSKSKLLLLDTRKNIGNIVAGKKKVDLNSKNT